jgi:endo-1,4-beta-xylanase
VSPPAVPCSLRAAGLTSGHAVGVAVDQPPLVADARYRATVEREFGAITPENAMKWGVVHPQANGWCWTTADAVVDFAVARSMPVHGHALVWHQQLPEWVDDALSPRQLRRAMDDHIAAVVHRYAGRVASWDVVNEALDESGVGLRGTIFSAKLGAAFIAQAFSRAHETDPDARLFYNDFATEGWTVKADAQYRLVRDLLEAGAPIHGVGLQMHLSAAAPPPLDEMSANIARFAALGLMVRISEMDVRVSRVSPANLDRQATVYGDVIEASLAGGASSVTFWGVTDRYSWQAARAPLLFDEEYRPKPAYRAASIALKRRGQSSG